MISPRGVPIIVDEQQAAADPELAVLSAMAHGMDHDHNTAVRIALAAQFGSLGLDADRSRMYCDLIFNSLADVARNALMNMNPAKYEYQSEFAKRYVAEGRAEGMEEGLERGHIEGLATLLMRLLKQKFGELPESAVARIREAPLSELEAMGDSVLTAKSLDDVVGPR